MRIVVDSSALIAIVLGESDAERFETSLFAAQSDAVISAATWVETMSVASARSPESGAADVRALVEVFAMVVEPVTPQDAETAVAAWLRFGKGRHPAGLNYRDCFAYALSKRLGAPLLFKGDDFAQTDVAAAP